MKRSISSCAVISLLGNDMQDERVIMRTGSTFPDFIPAQQAIVGTKRNKSDRKRNRANRWK